LVTDYSLKSLPKKDNVILLPIIPQNPFKKHGVIWLPIIPIPFKKHNVICLTNYSTLHFKKPTRFGLPIIQRLTKGVRPIKRIRSL
jgi:hypothetical protein